MRLFVAINLPEPVRDQLWERTASLRDDVFPIRWVRPEGLHLTLKFLGDVAPSRESEIVGALAKAVDATRPFEMPMAGFGAFPTVERPRVVWAGCEAVPPLELLQDRLERAMDALGFPLEGRAFRPHVTLGRAKRDAKPSALAGLAGRLDELEHQAFVDVRSIDLMESVLAREGARYTVRHAVELVS